MLWDDIRPLLVDAGVSGQAYALLENLVDYDANRAMSCVSMASAVYLVDAGDFGNPEVELGVYQNWDPLVDPLGPPKYNSQWVREDEREVRRRSTRAVP